MSFLATLVMELLSVGPELFSEADTVFQDIAHGKGGPEKVAKASAALTVLTGSVAKAVASVPTPPATPVE